MTDPASAPPFGLGAIESPPDDRDWTIDALYAMAGLEPVAAAPPSFRVPPPYPSVLNQHTTPQCVAYSHSWLKAYQDLRDTGPANFDEGRFFQNIGGTSQGAVVRYALEELVDRGYPIVEVGQSALHRIQAYYAVPVTKAAIQAAIIAFGPIELSTVWHWSWFNPRSTGVLPPPDATAGGHAIVAIGWDNRGLELVNSWGTNYGLNGHVWLPWSYIGQIREAWKAVDRVVTPPATAKYSMLIAAGTTKLRAASLSGGCISRWTDIPWSGKASSAPCSGPYIKRGCSSGQATLVTVTAGALSGKRIRIGSGVTVVRI